MAGSNQDRRRRNGRRTRRNVVLGDQLGPIERLEQKLLMASKVWDGGGGDDNWTTAANWDLDTAPVAGDDLVFPDQLIRLSNTNDFAASTNFNSITLSGGGYSISGNAITLADEISYSQTSGTSELQLDIALSASVTIDVANGGDLILSGAISGSGFGITKTGVGTLEYTGFSANTYTGATTVNAGTLLLNRSSGLNAIAGDLIIGNNSGSGDMVQLGASNQIADTSNVTVNSDGRLDLSGSSDSIGALTMTGSTVQTGAGTLTLGGDVTTNASSTPSTISGLLDLGGATRTFNVADGSAGTDLTVSAAISGTGAGIIKGGAASFMQISGNNTYDGLTTVSTGGLGAANANALGATSAGTVVSSGATLALQGGNTFAAEPLTIAGNGTGNLGALWSSSGTNTWTGAITLAASSFIGAESSAPVTISGAIDDGASSFGITKVRSGSVTLSSANTYDGGTTVSAGTLAISNTSALGTGAATVASGTSLALSGGISPTNDLTIAGAGVGSNGALRSTSGDNTVSGDMTLSAASRIGVDAGTLTVSSVISGSFDLTKVGAGVLELDGVNTYSGTTSISAGTLQIDGEVAGDVSISGGILAGSGFVRGDAITMTGGTMAPGTLGGTGIFTQRAPDDPSIFTFSSSSTFAVDLNGTTAGSGYDRLEIRTGGLHSEANLNDAVLDVNLGFTPAVNDTFLILDVIPDTSQQLNGTFAGLADGDTFTVTSPAGAVVTFLIDYFSDSSDGVSLTVTSVVFTSTWDGGDADDSLWSSPDNWVGDIAPAAGSNLVFPAGALRLSNINDFASGTSFGGITIAGAGYDLMGNAIDLDGDLLATYASGNSTLQMPIVLLADTAVDVASGGLLILSGSISGTGFDLQIDAGATGVVELGGENLFDGNVDVLGGFLRLTSDNALGDPSSSTTTTVQSGATLELAGGISIPSTKALDISGLPVADSSKVRSTSGDNTISGDIAITGGNNVAFDVASGTTLTVAGAISGVRDFDKNNTGTLILSGTSTHTGNVNVGEGTLIVDGSLATSNSVFIDGTLGGSGTVPATTISAIGTLSPGGSPGLLSMGALEFQSGSTYVVELDGTTAGTQYDRADVAGTVVLAGATLSVSLGYSPSVGDEFTIIASSAGVAGEFDGLSQGDTFSVGNVEFTINYAGGGSGFDVVLTVSDISYIWDGGGGDNNWTTAANWVGDMAPTEGSNLVFPDGAARLSNTNDFADGTDFGTITIAGAGYTLAGNRIDLTGDILASYGSGSATLSAGLKLMNSVTIDVATSGELGLSGQITSDDFSQDITKTGGGTLRFAGSVDNLYDDVFANEGTVALAMANGSNVNSSDLFIGDNTTAATVVFEADRQLWAGANVTVNEGSTLDLGVFDADISNLYLQGASVLIDDGGLLEIFIGVFSTTTANNATSSITGGGSLGQSGSQFAFDVADDADVAIDLSVGVAVTGSNTVSKTGAGTLQLTGDNVYTGSTAVTAGTLRIDGDNNLGAGAITLAGGSTLAVTATTTIDNAVALTGNATLALTSSTVVTMSGLISGSAGLTASGSGDLALTNTGNEAGFSGAITVAGSVHLLVADDDALGSGGLNLSGGWLYLVGETTVDNDITLNSLAVIHVDPGNTAGISGAIGESGGSRGFNKSGSGTLVLSGTSTYTGNTTLNGGVVSVASDANLGSGPVVLNNSSPTLRFTGAGPFDNEIQVSKPNGTIDLDADAVLSGVISGGSDLTITGPGAVTLTGTSTHTGSITIASGTALVDGSLASSSGVQVQAGATLGGTGTLPAITAASGATVAPGNSPGILSSGDVAFTTGTTFAVELDGTTVGTEYDQLDVAGTVDLGGATLDVSLGYLPSAGDTFRIIDNDGADAISGTFADLAEGGTFRIGPVLFAISYVAGDGNDVELTVTDVSYIWDGGDADDSLWSSPDNWLGDVAPTPGTRLVFPDGAPRLSNFNDFAAGTDFGTITIAGAGYDLSGNAIDLGGDIAATFTSGSSSVDLDLGLTATRVIDVAGGGRLDLSGTVSGTGFGITKTGAGTLRFTGTAGNTYTGTTAVNEGALTLGRSNNDDTILGPLTIGDNTTTATVVSTVTNQIANFSAVTVNEGSTFRLAAGATDQIYSLTLQGATVELEAGALLRTPFGLSALATTSNVSSVIQGPGSFSPDNVLSITVADDPEVDVELRISAVYSSGGLDKTGLGTLALSGENTYASLTLVSAGTLRVEGSSALGTTDGFTVVESGASLVFEGVALDLDEHIKLNGTGIASRGALYVESGTTTLGGAIQLLGDAQLGAADGATLVLEGAIGEAGGARSLTINGGATGTVYLAAANTYTGDTIVEEGEVWATDSDAFGAPVAAATVSILPGATLVLFGGVDLPATKAITLDGAAATGRSKLMNASGANSIAGGVTLTLDATVDVAADSTLVLSGDLGRTTGAPYLTKAGAGTLVLSGDLTYPNFMLISAGTLLVDGDYSGGLGLTVSNGATLGGSGSVAMPVVMSGGIVAPGSPLGILTTGPLNTTGGSVVVFDIDGPLPGSGYDQIIANGAYLYDATLSLDFGYTPPIGGAFKLIDNVSGLPVGGTFNGLAEGATITVGAATYTISYVGGDGNDVVLTATDVSYVWSGASNDGREWTIGANWVGSVAPTPGSNLIFPVSPVRTESVNDFAGGTAFHSLTIAQAGYDIYGNGIGLVDGIDATLTSGSSSFALDVNLLVTQTIDVAAGGTLDMVGALTGPFVGLIKDGLGTLIFGGNTDNTYIYGTEVNAGTLLLNKVGAIAISGDVIVGNGSSAVVVRLLASDQIEGDVEVDLGSTFDLNGFDDMIGDLELTEGTVNIPAGSTLTVDGDITSNASPNNVTSLILGPGTLDLNGDSGAYIYPEPDPELDVELRISAVIANGGLDIHDDGVVALSGANTYDGDTAVGDGAILVENDSALGSTLGRTFISSGSAVLFTGDRLIGESFSVEGEGIDCQGALYVLAGTTNITGEVEIYYDFQMGAADGATLEISGPITGPHGYDLFIHSEPDGRVILSGDSTHSGDTTVTGGYVRAESDNAFGDPAEPVPVTIGDGATLELSGGISIPATKSLVLDNFQVGGSSKIMNIDGDNTYGGTVLLLNRFQSIDVAAGTSLTLAGAISGSEALDKNGAGTLVLSAVSDLTGQVNAYAGALVVTGDITSASGVAVQDGATLGGTGATSATSVQAGGSIAPGVGGPGILGTGDLDLALDALYRVDLLGTAPGSQYDQLDVAGTVALGGSILDLGLGDFLAQNGQAFTVISNDGFDAVLGTFAGLPEGAIFQVGGQPFQISYIGGDGNDVVLTSVAIEVTPANLPEAAAGSSYSQQLTASGGSGTGYTYAAAGLPAGLSIDAATGLISGTPTAAGSASVTVTITDSIGSTTTEIYSLTVNPALSISPAVLPAPALGIPYSQQLTPGGGSAEGYTFAATGLPEGLSISPAGLITGTTTDPTPVTATITLTDATGASTQRQYNFSPAAAASTAALAPSANPITFGQPLTLTATITSPVQGAPTATGTVEFYAGTTLLGSANLDENGVAVLTLPSLGAGSYSITAVYLGNALLQPSTSAPVAQVVNQATATADLASSAANPVAGTPFTLTATVTPALAGATFSFLNGEVLLGTATTDDSGVASLVVADLVPGNYSFSARFGGTANYAPATSQPLELSVARSQSQGGALVSSTPESFFGQNVTFTATFSANSVNGLPMTGDVDFFDAETGEYLGRGQMQPFVNVVSFSAFGVSAAAAAPPQVRGFAVLNTTALSVGDHVIRAVYLGDANYAPVVTETPVDVQVDAATTQTILTVATTAAGTTLTARIVVTSPGDPPIDGDVSFFAGDSLLGTVPVVNGVASLMVSNLPPGVTAFRAVYSGDGSVSPSSETVVASTDGPQIVSLSRLGYHATPTQLVIGFNLPLDAARAQDVANYRITDSRGRAVPVLSATYNPLSQTVTLRPRSNLNIRQAYTLTVVGTTPTGLTGANGVPLDGSGTDQPGTNFTTTITWRSLSATPATPAMTFADGQTHQFGGSFGAYINAILRATRARTARMTGLGRFGR